MRKFFLATALFLAALTGCSTPTSDALAPAAAAPKPDPNVCAIPTGMTKTKVDDNGRATATQDALVNRGTAIVDCDVETAPDGWRAWEVSGLRMGDADDGQDGLMVDGHGKALKPAMLRGITSTKFVTIKGTHFTARCINLSSTGKGCDKKKAEKPDTVMTINGRKVTIAGS